MIQVTQRSRGANRRFIVKNPQKASFWKRMAKEYPWIKVQGRWDGVKIKEVGK